jgi:hypothetical protein
MQDMGNSSGVSVARNMVFATAQSDSTTTLFALKLDAGGGGGAPEPPALPEPPPPPGGGEAPLSATILTGPGAASAGYLTPVAVMGAGGTATYTNGDLVRHNVVSNARGADGRPLFQSALASLGQSVPVVGVGNLAPGTYNFFCQPHPNMKGQLIVG